MNSEVVEGLPVQPQVVSMSVETLALQHQVMVKLLAENQELKDKFNSLLNYARELEAMVPKDNEVVGNAE